MPKDGEVGARLSNAGIAAAFVWRGDRFEHMISQRLVGYESIEPPGLEAPVYQEVHQQDGLVFASGMWGDRHWSASVEPCDGGLLFDVACRIKTPGVSFGAAYRTKTAAGLHVIGKPADELPPPTFETDGDELRVLAPPVAEVPATLRFRYAIVTRQTDWIAKSRGKDGG